MNIRHTKIAVAAIALAGLAFSTVCPAHADLAMVPTLYNTGVDDQGAPFANSTVDTHYTLTTLPSSGYGYEAGGQASVLTESGGYPAASLWIPADGMSGWITPDGPATGDNAFIHPQGIYTYETTFDLTGVDPNSVTITGKWATDDAGVEITGAAGAAAPVPEPATLVLLGLGLAALGVRRGIFHRPNEG